ncbi:MAG: tRNA (guanosine(37)-N1)-methyltransferase TrmD [Candidatus Aminicenantes bacterium]|nr:tRNA (guanosine(37)-N1)-methyltransferase TrmD [Candidatus Aminicenantes bacterium]
MRFDIITIFPEMFASVFSGGIIRKAVERGLIQVNVHNLRDYATGKHRQVDDRPFGGDEGMVFKPEPIFAAVESLRGGSDAPAYLLSPQGRRFDQRLAEEWARFPRILLICGRYEGVDERVSRFLAAEEVSIGDYVLTGGEPAAVVIVDAVSRFVPGVVGKEESVARDSFSRGLLDFPHYTRPREFRGMKTPEVLFSGNHGKISSWRRKKALEKTRLKRPDLLAKADLSPEDRKLLERMDKERKERKTP